MKRDVEHVIRQSNHSVSRLLFTLSVLQKNIESDAHTNFLGVIAVSTASHAQAALEGVWQGQLGSSKITACFNPESSGQNGSYYYSRYLAPIQLSRSSVPGEWREAGKDGGTTGTWSIDTPSDTAITGTWRSPKDGTALPVVLHRIEPSEASKDCGSDAFVNSLETTNGVTTIEKFSENGHPYTVATKAGQKTLVLSGNNSVAIRKINNAIAKIAHIPDGVKIFNQERRKSLADHAQPYTSEILVRPTYWAAHWVTVQFYHWQTGYGASGISYVFHTWNLDTGEEVDPWSWIGSQSKLSAWLKGHTNLGPECAEQQSGHGALELLFNEKGITLMEEATGSDCDLEYFLSWQDLKPMLSAKGNAAFASLQIK